MSPQKYKLTVQLQSVAGYNLQRKKESKNKTALASKRNQDSLQVLRSQGDGQTTKKRTSTLTITGDSNICKPVLKKNIPELSGFLLIILELCIVDKTI